jgi:hypothetical protein
MRRLAVVFRCSLSATSTSHSYLAAARGFAWMLRQKITNQLNMYYVAQMSVFRLTATDSVFWSIVKRSARPNNLRLTATKVAYTMNG